MKISHRQLVECQRNPAEWVSNQVNPTATFRRPVMIFVSEREFVVSTEMEMLSRLKTTLERGFKVMD